MKFSLYAMLLAISAIGLLSSCAKIVDFKKHHPGADEHFCSVKTMGPYPSQGDSGVVDFFYNAKGNPVKIYPRSLGQGRYIQYFRYDKYDRLVDFDLDVNYPSGDTTHVFYERYYYPANKKIIYDTTYQFPSADYPYYAFVHKLNLDEQDRIVADTIYYRGSPTVPYPLQNFQYDGNGNLTLPGVIYDDKVNIYRTNKWFMQAYVNYSRNNGLHTNYNEQILQYNAFDLPTIAKNWGAFYTLTLGNDGQVQIRYTCDAPSGPGHGY